MILSNDQPLFETYLAPVLPSAYGFAYYLLQDHEAAETLVLNTAQRAFLAFPLYQPGMNFTVWFLKTLTQAYLEMLQQEDLLSLFAFGEETSANHLPDTPGDEAGLFSGNESSSDPFASLTETQIADAFARLPLDIRLIVALYFMAELSYLQIADILGCPARKVRAALHRGRWTLHHLLSLSARTATSSGHALSV